jgi:hypothetical protein
VRAGLSIVIGGLLIGIACSPATRGELLFADDFSSGDFSHHSDHFRWGRSGRIEAGDPSRIVSVTGPAGEATHAVRFAYGTWQELRFHLTENASESRSERGQSRVAHPEVWISYWMRVPDNYFHRHVHPSNNKGWVYLWKDGYEHWSSDVPDTDVTPTTVSLHWWAAARDASEAGYGMSRVSLVSSRGRDGRGHRDRPSFARFMKVNDLDLLTLYRNGHLHLVWLIHASLDAL